MRRVLEMGHGGFPMGDASNCSLAVFSKKLPPETIYFGIDEPSRKQSGSFLLPARITSGCVSAIEKACEVMHPRRIHFLRTDARSTRFGSGVFHEIHLHNVITDPCVSLADIRLIVAEARRLLAGGGIFIASCEKSNIGEERITEVHDAIEGSGMRRLGRFILEDVTVFSRDLALLRETRGSYMIAAAKRA